MIPLLCARCAVPVNLGEFVAQAIVKYMDSENAPLITATDQELYCVRYVIIQDSDVIVDFAVRLSHQ